MYLGLQQHYTQTVYYSQRCNLRNIIDFVVVQPLLYFRGLEIGDCTIKLKDKITVVLVFSANLDFI